MLPVLSCFAWSLDCNDKWINKKSKSHPSKKYTHTIYSKNQSTYKCKIFAIKLMTIDNSFCWSNISILGKITKNSLRFEYSYTLVALKIRLWLGLYNVKSLRDLLVSSPICDVYDPTLCLLCLSSLLCGRSNSLMMRLIMASNGSLC